MPLYVYRWQNGIFSAVSADSQARAIFLLDEIGNAEACELVCVKDFTAHFRLKNKVDNIIERVTPFELVGFGAETLNVLYTRVYPLYGKAVVDAAIAWPDEEPEKLHKRFNDALFAERTRQWRVPKPGVSDPRKTAQLQEAGQKAAAVRSVKERRLP